MGSRNHVFNRVQVQLWEEELFSGFWSIEKHWDLSSRVCDRTQPTPTTVAAQHALLAFAIARG